MARKTNETLVQEMIDRLTAWREHEEEVQGSDACTETRSDIADERISALDDAIAALEPWQEAMVPIAER